MSTFVSLYLWSYSKKNRFLKFCISQFCAVWKKHWVISFKVFMNQESPSKSFFQLFIKNTTKQFLEKMNFSLTLPKIYFYNNSPNSFFKCPHNSTFRTVTFLVLLLRGICFMRNFLITYFETINGNCYGVAWN